MNPLLRRRLLAGLLLLASLPLAPRLSAGTTTDPVNRYAYGANIGWTDWTGDTNHGAVIGNYICSGYIYAGNVGWINLGNGSPANGIRYQNNSATDFGINHDGLGNLRGFAYSPNIGWINFEATGNPTVDLRTGVLRGNLWSANCGWIPLTNAFGTLQTDSLSPGALDTNGLPVAWELSYFGHLGLNPSADPTGKGMTIAQDYVAGTNPNDPTDTLRILTQALSADGLHAALTWATVPTRAYYIEKATTLAPPNWTDSGLGLITPDGTATTRNLSDTGAASRFYRVRAALPLGQ